MNYDLLNELATDNTRIGVIKGDYEALESRAQYAEAALEVLKAKVRIMFDDQMNLGEGFYNNGWALSWDYRIPDEKRKRIEQAMIELWELVK